MKIIQLAIRSILHFRSYTLINILGLALSLACVIVIFRYVYGEFTVGHFNQKIDRLYVTIQENTSFPGKLAFFGISNPNNEKTFVDLRSDPGVEIYSDFCLLDEEEEISIEDKKYNAVILAADSNFFKISNYDIVEGIVNTAEPKTALLTKKYALKLFGKENPIGKTIRYSNGELLTITGIIGEASSKDLLHFDMVISYHLSEHWSKRSGNLILLHPNTDYKSINKKYENFFEMSLWGYSERYQLYPYKDIYFSKNILSFSYTLGNYTYTIVLLIVGILILLIGIVNFINIYTMVILRRGREFGMKKVFGAEGRKIFIQLFTENLFMVGVALILALILSEAINPFLRNNLGIEQLPSLEFNIYLSAIFLIVLPLLISVYPFIRYNYSKPITSIRNLDKVGKHNISRNIFLCFQYVITIAMIIISIFFAKQLYFMLHTDPGYRVENIIKTQFQKMESDNLIRVSADEWEKNQNRKKQLADEIKQKLDASPLFSSWTYGYSPNDQKGFFQFKTDKVDFQDINLLGVNEAWLNIFDIQLIDGRLWDDETENHLSYNLIVSESLLKLFEITDYKTAELQPVQRLWLSSEAPQDEMKKNPPYRIVGVIKDFNTGHLSGKQMPTAIFYSTSWWESPIVAAIVPGRKQEAIAFLDNLNKETVGGEFSYSFVEDEINEIYKEDKKVAVLYSIFTIIAIIISSLGLFSISLFDIQQRYREIAIRKVNGASYIEIISILLKKYSILLCIAFVIAAPLSWMAINRYLEDFALKAPVSWWLFVIAFAVTAIISLLTLIYQTRKAANTNPAKVLKSE